MYFPCLNHSRFYDTLQQCPYWLETMVMSMYASITLLFYTMLKYYPTTFIKSKTLEPWYFQLRPLASNFFSYCSSLTSLQTWFLNHLWLSLLLNAYLKVRVSDFCNLTTTFKAQFWIYMLIGIISTTIRCSR